MVTPPLDQTGPTPAFAMALARVVIQWGGFEETLRAALAELYRHPMTTGRRRRDIHTFAKRVVAWAEAIEDIEGDRSDAAAIAAEVQRRAGEAARRRNLLVQGGWPRDGWTRQGCKVLSFNALDSGILREAEVTAEGLDALADEISALDGRVATLMASNMARDAAVHRGSALAGAASAAGR